MIYIIEEEENGPVKIGTAVDVERRIKILQGGNSKNLYVIMAFEGGSSLEASIHKDLSNYKIRPNGEWFHRNPEVFRYLNKLSTVEPKTEWIEEEEYVLLYRETEESGTDYCPYCGKRHFHGKGDGHRVAHCSTFDETFTRKSDGKCFNQNRGYIVKTKKK